MSSFRWSEDPPIAEPERDADMDKQRDEHHRRERKMNRMPIVKQFLNLKENDRSLNESCPHGNRFEEFAGRFVRNTAL